jgi:hypothetical protein
MTPAPAPDEAYRGVTRVVGIVIIGFGIAIVVRTLTHGGTIGSAGIWLGLVFIAMGAGRLYLALRRHDG